MRLIAPLITLTALFHSEFARPATHTLRYEFTPLESDSTRRDIRVRATFTMNASGRMELRLPSNWAGHDDLFKSVSALQSASSGTRVEATATPDRWTAFGPPGAAATVAYTIHQDWSGPTRRPYYFRAIAGRDFTVLVGQNALVIPDYPEDARVAVTSMWTALPSGWKAASSVGEKKSEEAVTVAQLRDALFVAGLFRWETLTVRNRPVVLASIGNERTISDSAFRAMANRLLVAQRKFWSDDKFPSYLIARIPIANGGGGTAFTNAVMMYADSNIAADGFSQTLAHELFHAWNGHKLRLAEIAGSNSEGSAKWFSEGFTDFYADRFAFEAKFVSRERFLSDANRKILDYHMSPVRNTPQRDVAATYWSNASMNQLPYLQGYVLAGLVDSIARQFSGGQGSLDAVMRTLLRNSRGDGTFSEQEFVAAFPKAAQVEVRRVMADYIRNGGTVPLAASAFGQCVGAEVKQQFAFDIGFDPDATIKSRSVTGLRTGSAAEGAGLRNGMKVAGFSWRNGLADSTASITVTDSAGAAKKIQFLPRSAQGKEVPVLVATQCAALR